MQLIDALEERTDSTKLVEGAAKMEANYDGFGWTFFLDDAAYHITEDAFDTLLNLLRIPIKYIKRCVEDEGKFLAEASINYWLEKYGDISFLVQNGVEGYTVMPCITQVLPGKSLYIPGVKVNDYIFEYLGDAVVDSFTVEDDVFNAVYITDQTIELDGESFHYGVRVLYSDCFKITPRFDGVLCSESGSLLAYPTVGRKFRVAGSTIPQVFDQIDEFLDLSIDGLNGHLIPAIQSDSTLVDPYDFISHLCDTLRLSKKIQSDMKAWLGTEHSTRLFDVVKTICWHTTDGTSPNIDVELARDIQIAVCNYICEGKFK